MRIRLFGVTLSSMAALCGCVAFYLLAQEVTCEGPDYGHHCPNDTITPSGGQCELTYYDTQYQILTDIVTKCIKHTSIVRCNGDTSAPSSSAEPSFAGQRAATAVLLPVNQLQAFVSTTLGSAPFDLKQDFLSLPFQSKPAKPTIQTGSGSAGCDQTITVLSAGFTRGSVLPLNPCLQTIGAAIFTGVGSLEIALTPDAKFAFVTNYSGGVVVINTATNSAVSTIPTPAGANPFGIAISPDGAAAYVAGSNSSAPALLVIDVAKRTLTNTVPLPVVSQNVFISPDGNLLWITSQLANTVTVLDVLTLTPVASITSIQQPVGLAFNATGTTAYITSSTSPGAVQVVNTADYSLGKSFPVGNQPADIRIGTSVYATVVNRSSDFVSVINLATGEVTNNPTQIPLITHAGLALVQ